MELCAGQEAPVRAKINGDPVAQCPTEPCTPGLGGFLRQRRCGHHRKLCPVDKLVCESFSFCLRQVSQVLLDACKPSLGAEFYRHLGEQSPGDVRAKIESSAPRLRQCYAAFSSERLARGIDEFCCLAFRLSTSRRCRFRRLCGRLFQRRRPLGCDARVFGRDGG